MAGTFHRRIRSLIAITAAATISWWIIPGSIVDQLVLRTVIHSDSQPRLLISGNGSHSSPWKIQTYAAKTPIDLTHAPAIVALGDDPDGFFQSSPVSPIDLAVIFKNIQRLGVKKTAAATLLAWDAPDPIGLAAMEKAMDGFESMTLAAPLSRGAVPDPMPPAFRRASIPLTVINGHTSSLPVVNRVPVPGVILGGDHAFAGFQTLDSEPTTGLVPLIARWNDRAVFAFPIVAILQQLNLPFDGVEVQLGRFIKLGPLGPVIPIDRYGRMAIELQTIPSQAGIPAETLIDAKNDLFADRVPDLLILIDARSAAEPATRLFSQQIPTLINTITSQPPLSSARIYPRIHVLLEIGCLAILILLLVAICELPLLPRIIACLNFALICLAAQFHAAQNTQVWLPGIPILIATFAALISSIGKRTSAATATSPAVPDSPQIPDPSQFQQSPHIPDPSQMPAVPTMPTLPQMPTLPEYPTHTGSPHTRQ